MNLTHLGVIAARGPDSRRFLNGQLSQDLLNFASDRTVRAGLHNPQGRVLAVMLIIPQGPDDVLILLPRERVASTLALLQRYVLRAKTRLSDETTLWRIEGGWPESTLANTEESSDRLWRYADDGRWIRLVSSATSPGAPPSDADLSAWHLADIRAGLPSISEATAGEFVAQMLNLDLLEAISFTKGCYTGQEVIARAHYRGRVKRRLQRFDATMVSAGEVTPAGSVTLQDGRNAQVLQTALNESGVSEFLAVTTFDQPSLPLSYVLPQESEST